MVCKKKVKIFISKFWSYKIMHIYWIFCDLKVGGNCCDLPVCDLKLGNKYKLSKILCIVSTILLNTMVSLCQMICQASETHAVVSEIVWYCFEVVRSPLKCANHFCHIRHNYSLFTWLLKIATPCETSVTSSF